VEIQLSPACACDNTVEVKVHISRERNLRVIDGTTAVPCQHIKGDGAMLDLIDLANGEPSVPNPECISLPFSLQIAHVFSSHLQESLLIQTRVPARSDFRHLSTSVR